MPRRRWRDVEWPPAPEGVLVSYSGGKDSLVCLDLAVRHYGAAKVEAFFMYFLPDLDYTRVICDAAADRYGIAVHGVQHWYLSFALREGVFCDEREDCPEIHEKDVAAHVRLKTGKRWIVYGYRADESLERAALMSREFGGRGIDPTNLGIAPVAYWRVAAVRAYLRQHRIAIPFGRAATRQFGVSLLPESMHWLRQTFPRDYETILKVFPYARGQADRWHTLRAAPVRVSRDPAQPDHERALQPADDRPAREAEAHAPADDARPRDDAGLESADGPPGRRGAAPAHPRRPRGRA